MSRDFIIRFKSTEDCIKASKIIVNISDSDNKKLFGDIHIKKDELFVSFIYDQKIEDQKINNNNHDEIILKNFVNFVAIKNGMHNERGFVYFDYFEKSKKIKLENIKSEILKKFNV